MNVLSDIDLANWRAVPCVHGRIATRLDSEEGRAAFFIPRSDADYANTDTEAEFAEEVQAIPLGIPRCAVLNSDGEEVPVILIQAEVTLHHGVENRLAGYRGLDGSIGLCMLSELTLLEGPDERFFTEERSGKDDSPGSNPT